MPLNCIRAIVVNYNGYADTIECLESLKGQVGVDCQPVVIDNASHNDSVSFIKAAHPDVEVLESGSNLGFAGGNNVGIRHALEQGCDYLFLVNNDTVMEPDCLKHLLECAVSHPEVAITAPAMYYYADRTKPWFTGSAFDTASGETSHIYEDVRRKQIATPYQIPWSTGCAMLIPAKKMRQIGGFDERYFCYWEDVDLCWRASENGLLTMLCPTAILYHKVSATAKNQGGQVQYYMGRNKLLCLSRHVAGKSGQQTVRSYAKAMLQHSKHIYRYPTQPEDKKTAIARTVGVVDFYLKRFGQCRHAWLVR